MTATDICDASQRKDACQKPEIATGELYSLKKNEALEPKNPLELQRIWVNINTKLISFFFIWILSSDSPSTLDPPNLRQLMLHVDGNMSEKKN